MITLAHNPLEKAVLRAALGVLLDPTLANMDLLQSATIALAVSSDNLLMAQEMGKPSALRPPLTVVSGDRQTGKTTAAAEWVKAGRTYDKRHDLDIPSRILVASATRAATLDLVRNHGLQIREVVSHTECEARLNGADVEYAVDNAELIIANALGQKRLPSLITVGSHA